MDITKCEVQVQGEKTGVFHSGIFTKRQNEMKRFLHFPNVDVCSLFNSGKTFAPILRFIRDAMDSGGNMPKKCPISNGYEFEYQDVNVDSSFFPFLPEMHFFIVLNAALNDVQKNYAMNITGEIINRRKDSNIGK